jgi:hypothetical protein
MDRISKEIGPMSFLCVLSGLCGSSSLPISSCGGGGKQSSKSITKLTDSTEHKEESAAFPLPCRSVNSVVNVLLLWLRSRSAPGTPSLRSLRSLWFD